MNEVPLSPWVQFLPFLFACAILGTVAYLLAKEKGRNARLWAVLACIPVVNFACLPYFVGAANLRLERKVDRLLTLLEGANVAAPKLE